MNLDVQIKNTAPLKNNLTLKTNPDNKGFEINMKKMKHRIALDKVSKLIMPTHILREVWLTSKKVRYFLFCCKTSK